MADIPMAAFDKNAMPKEIKIVPISREATRFVMGSLPLIVISGPMLGPTTSIPLRRKIFHCKRAEKHPLYSNGNWSTGGVF
jgi:hypothetical protein